jgi:hypothetical protein
MTTSFVAGKDEPGRGLPLPSASTMFIIRAGEEGAPSRGLPPRGQRPAPSLSDRGEGRSPPVALSAATCLALWRIDIPRVH